MVVDRETEGRSWGKWGPASGVAFVALLAASFLLGTTPDSSAGGAKVIAYYTTHRGTQIAGAVLLDLGVVVGLFFFGYLRDVLSRTGFGSRLAPVAFGGAVLFAGGGAIVAGTTVALTDVPSKLSPAAAQALNVLNNDVAGVFIGAGLAVLWLATAITILQAKVLPAWTGWLSAVIGVVAAAGPLAFFAFLASGVWILVLSVLLYRCDTARSPSSAHQGASGAFDAAVR
jgi:hypothetical protein